MKKTRIFLSDWLRALDYTLCFLPLPLHYHWLAGQAFQLWSLLACNIIFIMSHYYRRHYHRIIRWFGHSTQQTKQLSLLEPKLTFYGKLTQTLSWWIVDFHESNHFWILHYKAVLVDNSKCSQNSRTLNTQPFWLWVNTIDAVNNHHYYRLIASKRIRSSCQRLFYPAHACFRQKPIPDKDGRSYDKGRPAQYLTRSGHILWFDKLYPRAPELNCVKKFSC